VCFNILYYISENSKLGLAVNNNNTIDLSTTRVKDGIEWQPKESEKICPRNFSTNLSDFNLTFIAKFDKDEDIVAINFKSFENAIIEKKEKILNELPFLTQSSSITNDSRFEMNNQWPIALPSDLWKLDNDFIEFQGD
jgi:hypothetical protein